MPHAFLSESGLVYPDATDACSQRLCISLSTAVPLFLNNRASLSQRLYISLSTAVSLSLSTAVHLFLSQRLCISLSLSQRLCSSKQKERTNASSVKFSNCYRHESYSSSKPEPFIPIMIISTALQRKNENECDMPR